MPPAFFATPLRLYSAAIMAGMLAAAGYVFPLPTFPGALLLVFGFLFFFLVPLTAGRARDAALAGFLFCLVFHGISIYWMFEAILFFGALGRLFGALLIFLYATGLSVGGALLAGGIAAVAEGRRSRLILFAGGPLVVLVWTLIHRGVFGFPWFAFGEWLLDGPLEFWIRVLGANWSGAIFLTFPATLAVIIAGRTREERFAAVIPPIGLGIISIGVLFGLRVDPPESTNTIEVQVVSLNYDNRSERPPNAMVRLGRYVRLSRDARVDLLVWPESTADEYVDTFAPVLRRRLKIDPDDPAGRDLFLGARQKEGASKYNVVYALADDRPVYRKRKLVPFTEYVPGAFFEKVFETLELTIKNNDILSGPSAEIGFEWRGRTVYPLLCYEIAYPELLRAARRPGFILNAGNETWFATPAVRRGTLRQARSRARESGLFVVRAITGGYSGFIDPYGAEEVRYDAHRSFSRLEGRVKSYPAGRTFYARWTSLVPAMVLVLFAVLFALSLTVPTPRRRAVHPE